MQDFTQTSLLVYLTQVDSQGGSYWLSYFQADSKRHSAMGWEGEVERPPGSIHPSMERGWAAGWPGLGEAKESTERRGPQALMQPEEAGHRPEKLALCS